MRVTTTTSEIRRAVSTRADRHGPTPSDFVSGRRASSNMRMWLL